MVNEKGPFISYSLMGLYQVEKFYGYNIFGVKS